MLRLAFSGLLLSLLVPACKDRTFDSEAQNIVGNNAGFVTIHVESTNVNQPMIFASVDRGLGECRGGKPKSREDIKQGGPIPELKVAIGTEQVCISGQATPTGLDIKYFNLPPNLKDGQLLVIKGDQIFLAQPETAQGGSAGIELTCEAYGAKLVIEKVNNGVFRATVLGAAAVLVRDQKGKDVTAIGGGMDQGRTWPAKKELPTTISHNFDRSGEAPAVKFGPLSKMVVSGQLVRFSSSQYGPSIYRDSNGFKMVIPFWKQTGSHTSIEYEYANWYFPGNSCK